MVRLLPGDAARMERARGSRRRVIPTRRHSEWSLSARHRAGLLHPSRPCLPRDHPPNRSIGPCLVIRPVGRTWRSSHVTPVPLNSWPRGLLPGNGFGVEGSDTVITLLATGGGHAGRRRDRADDCLRGYFLGDADGLVSSTRSSLDTLRTPFTRRVIRSASNLSSAVGTLP